MSSRYTDTVYDPNSPTQQNRRAGKGRPDDRLRVQLGIRLKRRAADVTGTVQRDVHPASPSTKFRFAGPGLNGHRLRPREFGRTLVALDGIA